MDQVKEKKRITLLPQPICYQKKYQTINNFLLLTKCDSFISITESGLLLFLPHNGNLGVFVAMCWYTDQHDNSIIIPYFVSFNFFETSFFFLAVSANTKLISGFFPYQFFVPVNNLLFGLHFIITFFSKD